MSIGIYTLNKSITTSQFEPILISISTKLHNNSNELWHRIRILKYASLLNKQYSGDIDIICALVLLTKPNTRFFEFTLGEMRDEEVERVSAILEETKFPESKLIAVTEYYKMFSKGKLANAPIEYQIVSDAILLSSFGAVGLARLFMRYESENLGGTNFSQVNDLFKERYKLLILPQSITVAEKENKFAYLFTALLQQEPNLGVSYPGKYIILEGNSGTGKNVQAEMLEIYLRKQGKDITVVAEPTEYYKNFESFIYETTKNELNDSKPLFRLYSIIGDRYQQIHEKVIDGLQKGNIVISIRSYISMLVYQCENEIDRLLVNYIHHFLPKPDIVILYDAPEEICLQRVIERAIDRGARVSPFDKLEALKKYRPLYIDIAKSWYFDFPIEIVDAAGTREQVAEATIKIIVNYL